MKSKVITGELDSVIFRQCDAVLAFLSWVLQRIKRFVGKKPTTDYLVVWIVKRISWGPQDTAELREISSTIGRGP